MKNAAWPAPSRLPVQPRELGETGLCARHPHPEWWVSSRLLEREAAAAVCSYCPVLEPCRDWAVSLPLVDAAIYGGMSAIERRRARRRAAQEPVPLPSEGDPMPGAA